MLAAPVKVLKGALACKLEALWFDGYSSRPEWPSILGQARDGSKLDNRPKPISTMLKLTGNCDGGATPSEYRPQPHKHYPSTKYSRS
jgi:hypothetical protein